MIEQVNQNLKQFVPLYASGLNLTTKSYKIASDITYSTVNQFTSRLQKSKENALRFKNSLQNDIITIVEEASNQLLTRTQALLLKENERPSESEKKFLKRRFQKVFSTIVNNYLMFYVEQARQYNMVLVKQGQQYIYANLLPLYIKLKATLLVSKEILIQMLENRLDDMKMTYSVSKDTVTMLIRGKFQEDKIIEKINSGMQNFKELTVRVVKKGLQIKVDKKSLYENYETFSLKLLQVIRQMRQKGAQRIVSARQKTAQLYQNVLNRIRQKEISLKMQYKELEDKKEQKQQ